MPGNLPQLPQNRRMPDKTCPACGLICSPTEIRCDCGHKFELTDSQRLAARERDEKGCLLTLAILNPAVGLAAFLGWLGVRLRRWRLSGGSDRENRREEPER